MNIILQNRRKYLAKISSLKSKENAEKYPNMPNSSRKFKILTVKILSIAKMMLANRVQKLALPATTIPPVPHASTASRKIKMVHVHKYVETAKSLTLHVMMIIQIMEMDVLEIARSRRVGVVSVETPSSQIPVRKMRPNQPNQPNLKFLTHRLKW